MLIAHAAAAAAVISEDDIAFYTTPMAVVFKRLMATATSNRTAIVTGSSRGM